MKGALVILDGWGIGEHDRRNAIAAADTPNVDRFADAGAYGTLRTDGRSVGLPDGQMGNSEVGHLTIGAGRTITQPFTRINDAIDEGSFADIDAIDGAFEYAERNGGHVHVLGLISDGGVHADLSHVEALIEIAAARGVDATTHAFTDGRDTPPTAGAEFLATLEATIEECGTGEIGTVSGRYYAMDRDENWERTRRAYDAIVNRSAAHEAETGRAAVETAYDRGETDEFVEPTIVSDRPAIEEGDAIIFANFRGDRARQLVRMLADIEPSWPFETTPPTTRLVTMTEYDRTFDLPVAFPPRQPADTLGDALEAAGFTQLRIAESEKYPHVTYFLNGGREVEFHGETRRIVPSPDVPTYDLQPEMSAAEVTDTAIDIVRREDPDVLVLNYANPDMVGHTGEYEAAIAAVEAVDEQLGRLVETITAAGGETIVTADHGNADDMGTAQDPHTAHTFNPVPVIYLSPDGSSDQPGGRAAGRSIREGGTLADLAPTLLSLVGLDAPGAMTGRSLLVER